MKTQTTLIRVLALSAMTAMLAACGGGGGGSGSSLVPTGPGANKTSPKANAMFKVTLPASSSSSSTSKRPDYISGSGTSSLVITVTPADPAEASTWATEYGASGFTVCYPIFNNGAPVTSNPNVVVTVGPPVTVSFPFPSPPGQDSFVVTQYAGTCASPYAAPSPAPSPVPTESPAQLIISQSPPLIVNLTAGVTNNFNIQLSACNTPPGSGPLNQPTGTVCAVPNPAGTTTLTPTLGASISFVYLEGSNASFPITLPASVPITPPIQGPMREQAVFTSVAADRVGFPIPVVGLDGAGNPVPYTAPQPPSTVASSGYLPDGPNNPTCLAAPPTSGCNDKLTLTLAETDVTGSNHFQIEVLDAKTGAIAQNPGTSVTLTQINALNCPADCAAGGATGDQYVVVATFDGSSNAASTSATVTLSGTLAGAALTAQVLTVKPQSSLFTAVAAGPANGYTDSSAPYTKAADILNIPSTTTNVAAGGQGYWVTDGGTIHQVGGAAAYTVTGSTTLTGETLDNNSNLTAGQILAVDNSSTASSGGTIVKSGVYVFDPVAHTSKPLAVQDATTGNYVSCGGPQAIAFIQNGYVYVFANAGGISSIFAIDPEGNGTGGLATDSTGNYYLAELVGSFPLAQGTVSFAGVTGFDAIASGNNLIFPSVGTTNIQELNTSTCDLIAPGGSATTTCATTTLASGHPFVGLSVNGSGYVASDTAGQIYTITSAGTVTSLGLSGGAVKDGVVGVIGTTPLAPIPYTTQGQTANFFGSAYAPLVPYNIPPFTTAGPVFGAVPAPFVADTSNATFGTTAGTTMSGFGVALIPVTPVPASTALTAGSYLFTDGGSLRTLVP